MMISKPTGHVQESHGRKTSGGEWIGAGLGGQGTSMQKHSPGPPGGGPSRCRNGLRAAIQGRGLQKALVVDTKVRDNRESPCFWSHKGQERAWGAWGTCQCPVGLVPVVRGERGGRQVGHSELPRGAWDAGVRSAAVS